MPRPRVSPHKYVALDPTDIAESGEPLSPIWPVSSEETVRVFDCIAKGFADLSKRYETEDRRIANLICMSVGISGYAEGLSLFQAFAALRRFRSIGIDLSPPRNSRLYKALIGGGPISKPALLRNLRTPSAGPSGLGIVARSVRDTLNRSPVPFAHPKLVNLETTPVMTIVNPLAKAHAQGIHANLVMMHRSTWFTPVATDLEKKCRNFVQSHPVVEQVGDIFCSAFAVGGEEAPHDLISYLCDLFVDTAALCAGHLEKILINQKVLPQMLWTGSGGNIWDRILKYAVRENGGSVTSHEHGPGTGYHTPTLKECGDFVACDRFITYTDAQTEGLAKGHRPQLCPVSQIPRVLSLREAIAEGGGDASCLPKVWPVVPADKSPITESTQKTVLYLDFAYDGERTRPIPKPSIHATINWQRQLFGRLKELGYGITNKYHPEYHYSPAVMEKLLDTPSIGGPLDDQLNGVGYIILVHPTSSAICSILKSDKSIIFIDFKFVDFHADARAALEKRVAIVPGTINKDNQICIDWAALEIAFEHAPKLRDNSFLELYLGN